MSTGTRRCLAAPSRPIERGLAGRGLLAHVPVSKFGDHLPLCRQSLMYVREGVERDRSLLATWVGHGATLSQPLPYANRTHEQRGIRKRALPECWRGATPPCFLMHVDRRGPKHAPHHCR